MARDFDAGNIHYKGPPLPMARVIDLQASKIIKSKRHLHMGRKTESLPQIVYHVLLGRRIINALPSTL
jgi:hypothetical protein